MRVSSRRDLRAEDTRGLFIVLFCTVYECFRPYISFVRKPHVSVGVVRTDKTGLYANL
jgi:hypothetical protein